MIPIRINPVYNEDYSQQWGKIDYKGKTVLDIGASNGDTADFFLRNGAKEVIAVEMDFKFYQELVKNAKVIQGIHPVRLMVCRKEDWEVLIQAYRPDVMKSDCEGCEITLDTISDEILCKVQEYIIEVHSFEIEKTLKLKFEKNGYELADRNNWTQSTVSILYWRKRL